MVDINTALYNEMQFHLLNDELPSRYLNSVREAPALREYPFCMLADLQNTPQSPLHHPEGNVWNHTLLVVDEAAKVRGKSKYPTALMWAALLHDIGKPSTTKTRKGRIVSYDHDKSGAMLCLEFLKCFSDDCSFINRVTALVRYHMHPMFIYKNLPFADIKGMLKESDTGELALLSLCDRFGRLDVNRQKEQSEIEAFLERVSKYETR